MLRETGFLRFEYRIIGSNRAKREFEKWLTMKY